MISPLSDRTGRLRNMHTQIIIYLLYKILLAFQRAFQISFPIRELHWTEYAEMLEGWQHREGNNVSRSSKMRINLSAPLWLIFQKQFAHIILFQREMPPLSLTGFQSPLKSDLFIFFLALFSHYFFNSMNNYWAPISCQALLWRTNKSLCLVELSVSQFKSSLSSIFFIFSDM